MADKVECWLPAVGWEDLYEVSNMGRVRSLDRVVRRGSGLLTKPGHVLSPSLAAHRHLKVSLCRDGVQVTALIHILVLRAFVGPPPSGMECLHGPDGSLDNNWPENLSYGTHAQNMKDKRRDGTNDRLNRMRCPRDHELVNPNLIPGELARGRRSCLACNRARSNCDHAQRNGKIIDLHTKADEHYRKIMTQGVTIS